MKRVAVDASPAGALPAVSCQWCGEKGALRPAGDGFECRDRAGCAVRRGVQ